MLRRKEMFELEAKEKANYTFFYQYADIEKSTDFDKIIYIFN